MVGWIDRQTDRQIERDRNRDRELDIWMIDTYHAFVTSIISECGFPMMDMDFLI